MSDVCNPDSCSIIGVLQLKIDGLMDKATTKIKILNELAIEILDDSLNEDDRVVSFLMCECLNCHWRFVGDCERVGYGYTSKGTQTPNYCPMCGKKIDDDLEGEK